MVPTIPIPSCTTTLDSDLRFCPFRLDAFAFVSVSPSANARLGRQRVFGEKPSLVTKNGSVEPLPASSFLPIVRRRLEPVGVLLCLHTLAARAVEAHQGCKHITIVWMICEIFFQSCDRFVRFASRVQCYRIDVRKPRVLWIEDRRLLELGQGCVHAFHPHQRKSKRVMKDRVLWRSLESVPQNAFSFPIAPQHAVEI